ncbi:hypothetical protein BIY23_00705 [Wolbachia pipientis]|uniref:Porin n=1 Tax=Wolbachia pipientis TaxID=955 RepID=A0A1E7QL43_WOLPI|nr:hypothetical protein [Wolbachia pipientis]OEY87192.1 hypothetical protein BIY23_00705 [Wolbachia pipientis]
MQLRYYSIILICLLQNSAYSMVLLDKQSTYIELNGKFNLKFNYPFNNKGDSKDRLSINSSVKCLCLQRIIEHAQIGFKVEAADILRSDILEKMEKIKMKEGYFILKNQKFGSFEYGKRPLVSQSMLISTSKFNVAAGGINSDWTSYVNLPDVIAKPGSYLKLESWKVISYISPETKNFQLGLSYENDRKLIGGGLTYTVSLTDNMTVSTAITGEFPWHSENIKHWYGGLHIKYSKLSGIFSCGNINERNLYYVNAGIAYHSESNKLSLTYFTSHGEDKLSAHAISLERPLVMNSSYYFDIVRFNTKEPAGYVFLAGLKLSF